MKVKICGLTDVDTALEAAKAGADFIGLVFAKSRRQVTAEKAAEIIREVRKSKIKTEIVGVFVQTPTLKCLESTLC